MNRKGIRLGGMALGCVCWATSVSAGEALEYSAVQHIETVPGPFLNRIYIAGDRERQDASLGGKTVTTIIRRDKGVVWLLIPEQKLYEEVEVANASVTSLPGQLDPKRGTRLGEERLDGQPVSKIAMPMDEGRQVAYAWVSPEGLVLKAMIPADEQTGRPEARLRLQDVQFGRQDQTLFELPEGYRRKGE